MVILYNPSSANRRQAPLPMSLLALGAVLEDKYKYEIIDGNFLNDPIRELPEILLENKATVLGMTVMPGPQLNESVPLVKKIKQILPDLPIVWGGYFPTQHSDVVLESGYVDYIVYSQGERTFSQLLEILESGGSLSDVKGISYMCDGQIKTNPSRTLTPLDSFPSFPYHRVNMERYIRKNYIGSRTTDYNSSFGCPFACSFCAVVSMSNRRWLPESPKRMSENIAFLKENYGVNAILFHDMDFFINESRTAEFCDRIKNMGINWWALGRIDELHRFQDSTWKLMKKSGLKMVFCGAESGSDEMLGEMNKGGNISTQLATELLVKMKSYDIVPEYSFVLGNPPDPDRDIEITFSFIRKLKNLNPALELILYTYTPVPIDASRGDLYEKAKVAGFTFPKSLEAWVKEPWNKFALRREPNTPWLDSRIYTKIRNFERVVNAYYPTTTDLKLTGIKQKILKVFGGWRYKLQFYGSPIELRLLQKIFDYQRPETTGF